MNAHRFRAETTSVAGRVVLELHGELDLVGSPLLARDLERAEAGAPQTIVLDLGDLEFIDSAGLRVILAANERARSRGGELVLTPARPQVRRLLEVSGVEEHLRIEGAAVPPRDDQLT